MTPERLRALVRLLLDSGDLTPWGARYLLLGVPEDNERPIGESGVGDE